MNLQQVVQPRSANGFGRRRVERESGNRLDNKSQTGKTNSSKLTSSGVLTANKGGCESVSCERLVYLTTCLIGHHVEVQVSDGSVLSGIFHATNAEKDFGIILKMARLTKGGSSRGQKNISDSVNKPPSKTLIIPARELVQIIAKGVSVTRDGLTNEVQSEKLPEIMTDSCISQSRHVDSERELGRWVPDGDNPECPELENIFDGPWNRGWDQFEANEALFGVKSTFDEDLYTTKLDRGPQMRELEREALRIAREIEGEDTKDLHLAEERGINLGENFDIDEETRYSSVFRGVDDSGYVENDDKSLDSHNSETFGGVSGSLISKPFTDMPIGKSNDGAQVLTSSSSMDEVQYFNSSTSRYLSRSASNDPARQLSAEGVSRSISVLDGESRIGETETKFNEQHAGTKKDVEKHMLVAEAQTSNTQELLRLKKESSEKGGLSPNATAYAPPSQVSSEKTSSFSQQPSENALSSTKTHGAAESVISRAQPTSSTTSSTSDRGNAAVASSGPGLSPSSSIGSLSSERSTLNPHAKEFKFNPNAKSFIPSQTPLRPASPVSEGSFYYPTTVPHMHGMPVGIGIGPSFPGHQPVMFNPQQAGPMQSPQPYFHSNGPQYGQQMMLAQPRQVLYMPNYPPEMPYKGREF
ncbi:hypothetical protein LguiB_023315 [Lonicera macranthoides]